MCRPRPLAGFAKAAKLLRITQITLPASPLGTPFNTEVDRLREFVRLTSEDGIRLSIKTEAGHLTEDPHTAVELCQAVRGLGITLDPSYYMLGPNAGRSYDQVFPYVYHTHLRDSTSQSLQVQVGLGELDYTRLINQLKRRSYNRAPFDRDSADRREPRRAAAGASQAADAARYAASLRHSVSRDAPSSPIFAASPLHVVAGI